MSGLPFSRLEPADSLTNDDVLAVSQQRDGAWRSGKTTLGEMIPALVSTQKENALVVGDDGRLFLSWEGLGGDTSLVEVAEVPAPNEEFYLTYVQVGPWVMPAYFREGGENPVYVSNASRILMPVNSYIHPVGAVFDLPFCIEGGSTEKMVLEKISDTSYATAELFRVDDKRGYITVSSNKAALVNNQYSEQWVLREPETGVSRVLVVRVASAVSRMTMTNIRTSGNEITFELEMISGTLTSYPSHYSDKIMCSVTGVRDAQGEGISVPVHHRFLVARGYFGETGFVRHESSRPTVPCQISLLEPFQGTVEIQLMGHFSGVMTSKILTINTSRIRPKRWR